MNEDRMHDIADRLADREIPDRDEDGAYERLRDNLDAVADALQGTVARSEGVQ